MRIALASDFVPMKTTAISPVKPISLKPGKLRLMYEANPMAFIVEQAGGIATNGLVRIVDIVPESLHQRVAVFLGSRHEVERATRYHNEPTGS